MLERYAAGNRSMLDLAKEINDAGFRPRSKRGRLVFSKASIAGMLSNPFYAGDITYHGEVIGRGQHEPIVSRELWDKVQRVREGRARSPQAYGARTRRPCPLSGVGLCASCGSPLWPNTTGGGRNTYYRCASRSRGDICSNWRTSCRSDQPESEVSDLFSRLELPRAWRERVEALVHEGSVAADVRRERRRLEDKIKRVQQALLDGVLDNDVARAEVLKARAALAARPTLVGAHVLASETLTDIHELWPPYDG
jgi:hypothetical protein